jgi:hypothetical protein
MKVVYQARRPALVRDDISSERRERKVFVDRYESQHWVVFKTGDSVNGQPLVAYTLTGVALATLQGTPDLRWNRGRLDMFVPIPKLPAKKGLELVQWAPFVSLSSIANDHQAVDGFRVANAGEPAMTSVQVEAASPFATSTASFSGAATRSICSATTPTFRPSSSSRRRRGTRAGRAGSA